MVDDGQGNYLYERLTEKTFQRLCAALLAHLYPGTRCYPVGHSDGGRDMARADERDGLVVYQVKWTSKPLQNPVAWLNNAVVEEADNIRRLVAEGATTYILVTSVAGTAVPGRGSIDRLDAELVQHTRTFGIPVRVWWRSDIDAHLDGAPTELKWAYSDMLAGHDLIRYITHGDVAAVHDQALRSLVMKVLAAQWEEDSKVKFKQVELTTYSLEDLFIDVEASRVSHPGTLPGRHPEQLELGEDPDELAGAAQYLLRTRRPYTVVRGEPGQGKSTLSQYVCQRHRAVYLNETSDNPGTGTQNLPTNPRFPLRIDLREYAAWLVLQDPQDDDAAPTETGLRPDVQLENYLAVFLTAYSGGLRADVALVHGLVDRLPMLLVLDGLDEVAHSATRRRVVEEIDAFAARLRTALYPQLIVTTRPNSSGLAEPSAAMFETIALTRLSPELRSTYLHKWARARSIPDRDRVALERTFRERSAESHIAQLADNPMQLTILLYLMQKRANSVPSNRTALYTSYMETFLDREAEKTLTVREHRADLEEVTSFLGWHLQAYAEEKSGNGQMGTRELQKAIMTYLFDVQKDESMFRDLFTAVTERVWALTSKVQGTFEFDVQPVREYFAARYLYEFAGADQGAFDAGEVLRNMVRRGYWLNTLRFYAGFACPNELAGMVEALEDERDTGVHPSQIRTAAWTLLADGVFTARVRSQNRAASLFLDDLSVRLIRHALTHSQELPRVSGDRGGHYLAAKLREQVAKEPAARSTLERIDLAWRLDDPAAFDEWWCSHMLAAAGTDGEHTWLAIAAGTQSLHRAGAEVLNRLALADTNAMVAALAAGAEADDGSVTEQKLMRAVLDGHASEISHPVNGYVGDLLYVLRPQYFLRRALAKPPHTGTGGSALQGPNLRQVAFGRLCDRDERFVILQQAAKASKRLANTSSIWGASARAVSELFGPCWLAAEITVIGAASEGRAFLTSGDLSRDSECFGSAPDYERLLHELCRNRSRSGWWADAFIDHPDSLSRAVWVLALVGIADEDVVLEHLDHVDDAVSRLPNETLSAVRNASSRLGASTLSRPLSEAVLATASDHSLATTNLLTHHIPSHDGQRHLSALHESALTEMARYGNAAWPALHALSERMSECASRSLLEGLKAYGLAGNLQAPVTVGTPQAAAAIIDAPFDYPMSWVLSAVDAVERTAARSDTSYLCDVARAQKWFTPHDG
ncbi:NACHT domain-containing protein [Streptomyces sp. NPDC057298]|uniref:NACHT domain-containing protein n=1 Tax=Streptomyces sp. NPDC057298 TaxID=3346091 RepID=UPI003625916C